MNRSESRGRTVVLVSWDLTPRLCLVQRSHQVPDHPHRTPLLLTNWPVPIEIVVDVGLVGGRVMPLAMITVPPSVLSIGYSLLAHLLLNRYKWLYTEVFVHPPDANYEKRKVISKSVKMSNSGSFFSPSDNSLEMRL